MIRVGSLFSGIGAPECAWADLGWSFRWCAEIERFPSAVLAARFPDLPNLGDVTKVDWDHVRATQPVDLLVAGSPCQSFSVAGKRLGLDDPRGNLALLTLEIARRLGVRWLVFENVPGLLSSDGGRDFGAFLGLLGERGPGGAGFGWAYRVLDAQYFGVPQRRRRIVLVGYLGDWRRAAAVLFEPESLQGHPAPRRETRQDVAGSLGAGSKRSGGRVGRRETATGHLLAGTLQANGKAAGSATQQDAEQGNLVSFGISSDCLDRSGEGSDFTPGRRSGLGISEGLSPTLRSKGPNAVAYGGNNTAGPIDVATACRAKGGGGHGVFESETFIAHSQRASQGGGDKPHVLAFSAKDHGADAGDLSPTLRAGGHAKSHANAGVMPAIAHAAAVRRLTPVECERLQGFPDGWTDIEYRGKPAADGPRYKAIGNSMAVPKMRWVGRRIDAVERLDLTEAAHR